MTEKPCRIVSWHFHWKFWDPKQTNCDKVFIGWWATLSNGERIYTQSAEQVRIKQGLRWIK